MVLPVASIAPGCTRDANASSRQLMLVVGPNLQGPPEGFELPEDMQLDGDGDGDDAASEVRTSYM